MRRFFRFIKRLLFSIIALVVVLAALLTLPAVQTFVAQRAAKILSDKLNTTVKIDKVSIKLLNRLQLEGLYIADKKQDTLLSSGKLQVKITDWFIFKKEKPVISYIALQNARVYLNRPANSPEWNYQFILDAFEDTSGVRQPRQQNDFDIDIKDLALEHIRFYMDDAWGGEDMDFDVGKLYLHAKDISFKDRQVLLDHIAIDKLNVTLRSYVAGKPPKPRPLLPLPVDTTVFNPDKWRFALNKFTLSNSEFHLDASLEAPQDSVFDESHIHISHINADIRNISILGDTVKGKVVNLIARERSGIEIKKLNSVITVSPNISEMDSLLLETNHSVLKNYYAMHYERFPDFLDYIEKVKMTAHLNDATIDARDIAFFAPEVKALVPAAVKVSGKGSGTVAHLQAEELQVSDGANVLFGDVTMDGLPDIYTTQISYTNGELMTGAHGILQYAPGLKHHPYINIEALTYAYFKGSFNGLIEDFLVNGRLVTSLGNADVNVKMKLPYSNIEKSSYSGHLNTSEFKLGDFIKDSELGALAINANIEGTGFDPALAQIKMDAHVPHVQWRSYDYKDINLDGVLSQKKFDGNLMINDSNLVLAFYGRADFNGEKARFNAKANLLYSDLLALGLMSDTIKAVADFDLDCTASSIDDFVGSARLYNINLTRNTKRLDVDSVYVLSESDNDSYKSVWISSNLLTASLQGNYLLSHLPYVGQLYLSRYIPNYIGKPMEAREQNQDFTFSVQTHDIDSLFAVLLPSFEGFSNANIYGNLNTARKQLSLVATTPYGKIGSLVLKNVLLQGDGNYEKLNITADINRFIIGDTALDISLKANTSLWNDSLSFKIETNSPNVYGTASINGKAYASNDTLYGSFDPSSFFVNKQLWDLYGAAQFIYSKNYLTLNDFTLSSANQKISINSVTEWNKEKIVAEIKNLDLGLIGSVANINDMQLEGRLNGRISIEDMLTQMLLYSDLKATNVKLMGNDIGIVNAVGSYNDKLNKINIGGATGIYRNSSSVTMSGDVFLGKPEAQRLNAKLVFNDALLNWTAPFLMGYVSSIDGKINGTIQLDGTPTSPGVGGIVNLKNAQFLLDVTGVDYSIPAADININSNLISFVNPVKVYDRSSNEATLTGTVVHKNFDKVRFNLSLTSPKIEAVRLNETTDNPFYGNVFAAIKSMTIIGPPNDTRINMNVAPAGASRVYLPIGNNAYYGTYSFVNFANRGTGLKKPVFKSKSKFQLNITAAVTPDVQIAMVLDPVTGDEITATGYGNLLLEYSNNNDMKIYGNYTIERGGYTFTFQRFYKKVFTINAGSEIRFSGPLSQIDLDIIAMYRTRAQLYDLLSNEEKERGLIPPNEVTDAKQAQDVDVIMNMTGNLNNPEYRFRLDLVEKRSIGTYAYTKLENINRSERDLLNQVASLLLIGYFMPPEGLNSSGAITSVTSNVTSNLGTAILSAVSGQLSNALGQVFKNQKLAIDLQYKNYNLTDVSNSDALNRNQVRMGLKQGFLNDRLVVEVGSSVDWGRSVTGNANNASGYSNNITGDFRVQYLITPDGRFRMNAFRISNYDVLVDKNISRSGLGISWRKSFDSFGELIGTKKK